MDSIQIDEDGLFSVTNAKNSSKMAQRCAHVFRMLDDGKIRKPVITDGCACVGGNVFGFALSNLFEKVQAVEFDGTRAKMLSHNVAILEKNLEKNEKCHTEVTVLESADYTLAMETLKQDIVFLDPPWGGPDYKTGQPATLKLGDTRLADIIEYLMLREDLQTKLVFWKAPAANYDADMAYTTKKMTLLGLTIIEVRGFNKMKLFYVNLTLGRGAAAAGVTAASTLGMGHRGED